MNYKQLEARATKKEIKTIVLNIVLNELQEQNKRSSIEIYYSNAIDYLKENDSSLKESLEIAAEYNYTLENLSSETLASLLASKEERENFKIDLSALIEDIEELNI